MDKSKELAALDDDQLDAVAGGAGFSPVDAAKELLEKRIEQPIELGAKILKFNLGLAADGVDRASAALGKLSDALHGLAGDAD